MTLVAGLAAALLAAGAFGAPPSSAGNVVPWFGLGFALYAVAFAAAGGGVCSIPVPRSGLARLGGWTGRHASRAGG